MITLDEAMEYLLTIDSPVEACARTYVAVYTGCVEILEEMLQDKKDGLPIRQETVDRFVRESSKLGKLEQLTMYQFVVPESVSAWLGRLKAAIEGAEDYGACVLFFDELRGRPARRYVPEDESEGLDDDAVMEPVLGFASYDREIPRSYTPEFREFVREVDRHILDKLEKVLPPDATDAQRAEALRDIVVEIVASIPFYGIHRILSGAMLPCIGRKEPVL